MYKADSGQILVNGKNIYDYDYNSYMKAISAVFQDYKLFNFSIEENISCQGDNLKGSDAVEKSEKVSRRGWNERKGRLTSSWYEEPLWKGL